MTAFDRSGLRRLPLFFLLMSGATGAWAQSGNVPSGKNLFENTAAATGKPMLMACTSCHGTVENRRMAITQTSSPFSALGFDQAAGAFGNAIATRPEMSQFRAAFSTQQFDDIAAYLADVPKFDKEDGMSFSVGDVNLSATQTLTLTQSQLPAAPLEVLAVAIDAGGRSDFAIGADACTSQTLPASTACNVTITYRPAAKTGATSFVSFSLRQGGASFTRSVNLVGTVGASVTPPSSDGGGGGGGGGAVGPAWLAALGLAVAALVRITRAPRPRRAD